MTSTNAPTDTATFLARADRFTSVVDAGPANGSGWDAPTPCAGWTAADVVDHVVETQREFLTARGADPSDRPVGDPAQRWHAHCDAVRAVLADGSLAASEYDGHFGRSSVGDTLVRFYGFDLLVHGWDLARGLGRDLALTADEVDALSTAADGFGAALHAEGVCGPALEPPPDATPQQRLLARLGRAA